MMSKLNRAGLLAMILVHQPGLAQQPVDERRAAPRDGTVKITNNAGSITVVAWDSDGVAIKGTLAPEIERLNFSTDERATRIRVVVPREFRDRRLEGSDLQVWVPRGSHVAVRTASGNIAVSDVRAGVDLESVEGDIRVEGAFRGVYAQTASGDIEINAVRKGPLRVRSMSGAVTVRGNGGYIDISTVSGDTWVSSEFVWDGQITSVSGDIHFEGEFERDASFYFESNSGTIELVLQARAAADFDITTVSGSIETDFPVDTTGTLRSGRAREYVFSVGGRGTHIRMKTYKGKVRIKRQE